MRKRLSTHAYPRDIQFRDTLPKTPSGKVQRAIKGLTGMVFVGFGIKLATLRP